MYFRYMLLMLIIYNSINSWAALHVCCPYTKLLYANTTILLRILVGTALRNTPIQPLCRTGEQRLISASREDADHRS